MRQEGKLVIFKDIEMGPTVAQKLKRVVSSNPLRYKRK